jgi:hypothetical protein
MTMKQFALFQQKEKHLLEKKKLAYKKAGNVTEKQRSTAALQEFYQNKEKYKKVIQLAKEEWMLSTDGVVKALCFNAKEKQFMAKVHYKEGTKVKELEIAPSDDWVFDTYGKEFANKLIDREEHQEFVKPLDESGKLAMIPFDTTRNITRVKYIPPKYFQTKDERGKDTGIRNEACAMGSWKALLEDGTVMSLKEEVVTEQFGVSLYKSARDWGLKNLFQFLWVLADHR